MLPTGLSSTSVVAEQERIDPDLACDKRENRCRWGFRGIDYPTRQQLRISSNRQRRGIAVARAADDRIVDARGPPVAGTEKHAAAAAAQAAHAPPQAAERAGAAAHEPDAAHRRPPTWRLIVLRNPSESILRRAGKLFTSFIFWLADSIAPPPATDAGSGRAHGEIGGRKQEAGGQQEA
jgi:hypothetical protein